MLRHKTQTALWLLTLVTVVAGGVLCCLTGRTAAHGLSIGLAAVFLAGTVSLTDVFLPNAQPKRVRRASGVVFALGWAALLGFYCWHFGTAETIYVNDDSLYYYQQLELANALNEGLAATVNHVAASLGTDYTCVANLLLAPIFSLTDRSIDGFGLACLLMAWTPLMFLLRRVALRLADRLRLTEGGALVLSVGLCVSVMALPIFHRAALWRQVNLLGLPLAALVMLLTLGADLRRWEPGRWAALLGCAVLLALLRRWFLFFLAGWLPLWGLTELLRALRRRDRAALLHLTVNAALCLMAGTLLLLPILRRAVGGNYTETYAWWRKAGSSLVYEWKNQVWLLGLGTAALIGLGWLGGLVQRRSPALRRLAGLTMGSWFLTVLLFTRIQNMTFHQITILMPAYALGMAGVFGMIACLRRPWLRNAAAALLCGLLIVQGGLCLTYEKPQALSPLLPHTSLLPPVREDIAAVSAVTEFIDASCTAEAPALILMNSADYDRLTFVTLRYPDLTLRQKVALDRIAVPSDGFPRAWFSARYILVPTVPVTSRPGGTVEKLTRYLLEDGAGRFEAVASFAFEGFELLVMERKGPVEYAEVEELMALFAQEHALYPKVWGDRIGWFYGLAVEGE